MPSTSDRWGRNQPGVRGIVIFAAIGLGLLVSCSNHSNQQLQQQAAQTTENVKHESQEALKNARIAAANAEQKVDAITAGVKEGMQGKPGPAMASRIDLNTASPGELASLPGISEAKAGQIIQHRPYASAHQLVNRGVLTESQYARISSGLTVR